MVESGSVVPTLRFSTDELPERERVAVWRELYGRQILRLEVEALPDFPFSSEVTLRILPRLGIVSGKHCSLFRVGRTSELLADGNDGLILQVATCAGFARQLGREVDVAAGDGILLSGADVGNFTFETASHVLALSMPRAALAPLLRDAGSALVRPIPRKTQALQLLVRYLDILQDGQALTTPELQHLAVSHVSDLVALALGATRDAAEIAKSRGVRAARLRAIKADITGNLERGLTIEAIAARHRVSPRYAQLLFEEDGTTFSEFLRNQRLARAYRKLTDPRLADHNISSVAYDVGFGDLSYFNRAFRRLYGATPSEVRACDGNQITGK